MRLIDANVLLDDLCEDREEGTFCFSDSQAEAADKIVQYVVKRINAAPTVTPEPGWISVKDRMPENGKNVLAACNVKLANGKSRYYVCEAFYAHKYSITCSVYSDLDADYSEETDEYYFPEGWWECIHNWDEYSSVAIDDFVTHWMPLPEPPKEET